MLAAEFMRAPSSGCCACAATMTCSPTIARLALSLRLRNPYADPMNLIQADLLQRWRAAERTDDALFGALVSSVHGVAQALQNTG